MEALVVIAIIILILLVGLYIGVMATVCLSMAALTKVVIKKFWEDR